MPMKVLKAFIVLFICLFCLNLEAQNLLGYKLRDIKKYMRENQKTMSFQGLTFNNTFKYAKFADREGNQTTLFFLTADTVCKGIRIICDKNMKADILKELDTKYSKVGTNKWSENRGDRTYLIELREEEFTLSVTISLKN